MPFQKGHKLWKHPNAIRNQFKKGMIISDEARKNLSLNSLKAYAEGRRKPTRGMLGKHQSERQKIAVSKVNKGKKMKAETKLKLSMKMKGKHFSPATEFKKGVIFSKEHKRKISLSLKGIKHKPTSEETKRKISAFQQGVPVLEWKGFITQPDRIMRKSEEYLKWRMNVFLRDNFTCQFCGVKGCYLEAHHIKSFKYFPELRFDINNGVTLCKNCHNITKQGRAKKNEK